MSCSLDPVFFYDLFTKRFSQDFHSYKNETSLMAITGLHLVNGVLEVRHVQISAPSEHENTNVHQEIISYNQHQQFLMIAAVNIRIDF